MRARASEGGSWLKGTANGDLVVLMDRDGDEKRVTVSGDVMRGTDKGGVATFIGRRVDAPARAATPSPPRDDLPVTDSWLGSREQVLCVLRERARVTQRTAAW